FFFSSRRRHTRFSRDWSSDVCSSDLFAFYLLLLLWAGAWLYTQYASRRITGHVAVDRRQVEVGEAIQVKLRLENEGWAPLPWVEIGRASWRERVEHRVVG